MSRIKESTVNDLRWHIAIKEVEHQAGNYPVFEWAYGTDKNIGCRIQAWPQGFLVFKESRDSDDEAFRTGNVEELLIWMQKVKNWTEEPPCIKEVWDTILETKVQFGKIEHPKTEEFFKLLREKLGNFCPSA